MAPTCMHKYEDGTETMSLTWKQEVHFSCLSVAGLKSYWANTTAMPYSQRKVPIQLPYIASQPTDLPRFECLNVLLPNLLLSPFEEYFRKYNFLGDCSVFLVQYYLDIFNIIVLVFFYYS